jgi:hypothetical protein
MQVGFEGFRVTYVFAVDEHLSKGQVTPAREARCKYSPTVGRLTPQLWAILRLLMPLAFSRSTSLIFLMDNLLAGILAP